LIGVALFSATASATHWRYGHITWTTDPGDPTNRTIRFTVQNAWRRDAYSTGNSRCIDPTQAPPVAVACTGAGGFPGVGDVIHERQSTNGTRLDPGDGSGLIGSPVTLGGSDSLLYLVTSVDAASNWLFGVAVDPGTYPAPAGCGQGNAASTCDTIIEHTYAASGTYEAEVEDCCRISPCSGGNAHINNPDNGFRTVSQVKVGTGESSPVSNLPPIILCPEDALCTFNVPVSDDEIDPMSFRMATDSEADFDDPGQAGGPGLGQPGMTAGCTDPTDGDASIGSGTGIYRWNTTGCFEAEDPAACNDGSLTTLYSSQVMIEEVGDINRVPLDFLISLVQCPLPNNTKPQFDTQPTPACGSTVSASPNNPVSFTVQSSDVDPLDVVTLNAAGLPAGATMTPNLPQQGNPVSSVFDWTPSLAQKGQHVVTFAAVDSCSTSLCSITIDVSEEICDDGVDNDGDDDIDCADPDCNLVSCDDGNSCTQADFCMAGVCTGTDPVICTPSDQCHASTCNTGTGLCEETEDPDGTACDDGDTCTSGEVCEDGVCTGDPAPNDTPCNDGDLCTNGDVCTGGVCGGTPLDCSGSGDDCNVGSCDPQTGICETEPAPDGTSCDLDQDQCSVDECTAGTCINVGELPVEECEEGLVIFGCKLADGVERILPLFARPAVLKNTPLIDSGDDFNKWLLRGEFAIQDNAGGDPDSQITEVILSQDEVIYRATLQPGNFVQKGKPQRPRWLFRLPKPAPDVVGAPGWRNGRFAASQAAPTGQVNRIRFRHKGNGAPIAVDEDFLSTTPGFTRARETIRVGNTCYTAVMSCAYLNEETLKCVSTQVGGIVPP
jgi:hypothetical protein